MLPIIYILCNAIYVNSAGNNLIRKKVPNPGFVSVIKDDDEHGFVHAKTHWRRPKWDIMHLRRIRLDHLFLLESPGKF